MLMNMTVVSTEGTKKAGALFSLMNHVGKWENVGESKRLTVCRVGWSGAEQEGH